jgi:hypothetical protein
VITEHTICALPEDNVNYWHYAIQVAYRGDGLWAVLNGGFCLGVDSAWDYEPSPSCRDDDWLATHRFDETTALQLAEEIAPTITVNGFTVADALAGRSR